MPDVLIYIYNKRYIFIGQVLRGMKYFGPILLIVLVFAIMVGGTYSRQELVQTSIQLIPTATAQPELVESTLAKYNGIHSVRLSKADNHLEITYNKARLSIEDLSHILISLGYRPLPVEPAKASAAM